MRLVIIRQSPLRVYCLFNGITNPYILLNSGFGTGSTGGGGGGNNTASGSPSSNAPSGMSMTPGAAPSGTSGGGGGGGGSSKADSENFLRGGWQTNDNGLVEFFTVYPGFCKCLFVALGVRAHVLYRHWTYYPYSPDGSPEHDLQLKWVSGFSLI